MTNEGPLDSFEKIAEKLRGHNDKLSAQHAATQELFSRVCKLERQLADLKPPKLT
jgi:hypothetical protein